MSDRRLIGLVDQSAKSTRDRPFTAPFRPVSGTVDRLDYAPTAGSLAQPTQNRPLLKTVLDDNIREWFLAWAIEWSKETGAHSSMSKRKTHPAYGRIVALGPPAVPLLLAALEEMPDFWFPMLRDITNVNPVPEEDRGDYERMTRAWLQWGRDNQVRG